jgi:hypothetical protein
MLQVSAARENEEPTTGAQQHRRPEVDRWDCAAKGPDGASSVLLTGRFDEPLVGLIARPHGLWIKSRVGPEVLSDMTEKPSVTLPGTVEKIVKSPFPEEADKVQINVERADHLYQEVRIDNNFIDENGEEVSLRLGAKVNLVVKAEVGSTIAEGEQESAHLRCATATSTPNDSNGL